MDGWWLLLSDRKMPGNVSRAAMRILSSNACESSNAGLTSRYMETGAALLQLLLLLPS